MYTVLAHELAAKELEELPDRLRGQMFRLIERLETEGRLKMPHSRVIGGGLFELRVGGADFVKKTQTTPARAIQLARQRLGDFQ